MQDLPFQTPTQWIALAITLIAGWFLGMATRSGSKWRTRYRDEQASHASYRTQAETELRDAEQRIRALEADNAALRTRLPGDTTTRVVETREVPPPRPSDPERF